MSSKTVDDFLTKQLLIEKNIASHVISASFSIDHPIGR